MATETVLAVSFSSIRAPSSSAAFMTDFGDQPAAAVYNSAEMAYVGGVMSFVLLASFRYASRMRFRFSRAGYTLVAVGAALLIAVAVVAVSMNVSHVAGHWSVLSMLSRIYPPLYVAAITSICIGASLPTVGRSLMTSRRGRRARQLLPALEAAHAGMRRSSTSLYDVLDWTGRDPLDRLHRLTIELLDFQRDPNRPREMTENERVLLAEATDLVLIGAMKENIHASS
ncbi:hypothetical protein C5C00_00575 [Rathayibacter rathayi]|nr:hypothetical protein C5C47_01805 [Rathayibacter rathayi]PPG99078.1 hypothetical protein C5C00_00575 [Rathayibacter rathayi]